VTTFDEFIEATALYAAGFSSNQDQVTALAAPVTNAGTGADFTVSVSDGSIIPNGSLIEVNSELMWVESVSTNTLTIAPFGRGYRGSTKTDHSTGDRVSVAPTVPRSVIERAVNDTIKSVWPSVFGVASTEFTFTGVIDTYSLPAEAERVLSVAWDSIGPTGEWMPARRWKVEQNASTTDYATGNSISIFDPVVPGRTVRVVYTTVPAVLTSGDNFSDSGLRDSCQDLVQFGAAARLVPWFEAGQAPGVAAEANYAAAVGRQSQVTSLARYFTQMYQLRLQEEAAALHTLFPVRSHFTR
jgi:hypothetical protein